MAGKRQSPWAGTKMEEVRSWKWEEMTVVLVGPAARLEENVREELKPQSLVSGRSNQNKEPLAKLEGEQVPGKTPAQALFGQVGDNHQH